MPAPSPSRDLKRDLKAAGIPQHTPSGKVDFHALRVVFDTLVIESGANLKEAMSLMRHSSPELTTQTYARTRQDRLHGLVEAVGKVLAEGQERARGVLRAAVGAEEETRNPPEARRVTGRKDLVELRGFEPLTFALRTRRSPN